MVLIEVLLHSLVVGTIFIGSSSYSSSSWFINILDSLSWSILIARSNHRNPSELMPIAKGGQL